MVDNVTWAMELDNLIFSKVKAKLTASLKTKYPQINITQNKDNKEFAKFPTVYIQQVDLREWGETLEGDTVNAVSIAFQADVIVTKTQSEKVCKEVANEVLKAFKSLHFHSVMPTLNFDGNGNLRMVSRYERIIGSGDVI